MKLINKGEFIIFEALDNKICLELNGVSIFLTDKQLTKLKLDHENPELLEVTKWKIE